MKNRLKANRKLVQVLSQLVEEHPDLRFSQILHNFEFVRPTLSDDVMMWVDEYQLEPDKLLERVTNQIEFFDRTKKA